MTEWLDAAGVAALLEPGMRVYVGGSSNEPKALLAAVAAHPECARGVTFVQFPLGGINTTDFTALHPEARMETYFAAPHLRDSWDNGRVDFVPMQMRRVFDHLASGPPLDLAFIQVAPSRAAPSGAASSAATEFVHGANVDFTAAAIGNARAVVAEVNDAVPAFAGAPRLAAAEVAYALASSRPLPEFPLAAATDEARAIGANIAALINDGDCLQTGIGAIPHAVLQALADKNDLGLHGGLLDDAGLALIERGVITGARKGIDTGRHVTGMLLGSAAFYGRVAERADVQLRGASYTHEASVIAHLDGFVSINSAVEIDLTGQVNAEMAGGRQISGTGGSVDFMRAAAGAPRGRAILALPATARGGRTSRIVRALPAGTAVTALRTDVDWVVTEHGAVQLKGQPLARRAELLTGIAAPAFRDELRGV